VRKVVEFGTLYGYSALAMAKALPADGAVITLEKDAKHHEFAKETFAASPDGKKVVALCGDALDLMREIESRGPFDMVFIDANKTGYVHYLNWAEQNVRRGGLIVGDNTFLWGALWGDQSRENVGENQVQVMKEFNERLADPEKYNSVLIPTLEGLTVAQKL
jgi:predicted O-methyltransferase YrrM